jgi:hypothetical protein
MTEDTPQDRLTQEIRRLNHEVARLNAHPFVRNLNSPGRDLASQFVRGLAFGLGTVLGATILVSFLAYALAQVNFIPIIGDFAAKVAQEIQKH